MYLELENEASVFEKEERIGENAKDYFPEAGIESDFLIGRDPLPENNIVLLNGTPMTYVVAFKAGYAGWVLQKIKLHEPDSYTFLLHRGKTSLLHLS